MNRGLRSGFGGICSLGEARFHAGGFVRVNDARFCRLVENGCAQRRNGGNRGGIARCAGGFRRLCDSFQAALNGAIALRVCRGFTNILLCGLDVGHFGLSKIKARKGTNFSRNCQGGFF